MTTRLVRTRVAPRLLGAFVALLPTFGLATVLPGHANVACAASDAHVAVIVEHGNGDKKSICVSFGGGNMSGEQALAMSGLQFATAYYPAVQGNAVCQIDGEPATPAGGWNSNNCLGHGSYWGIYLAPYGGGWSSSPNGVSDIRMADGDAEGFHFASNANMPPQSPAGVCPPPQPPVTPSSSGGGSGGGSSGGSGSPGGGQLPGGSAGSGDGAGGTPSASGDGANPTPSPSPSAERDRTALTVGQPSAGPAPRTPALIARPPDVLGIGAAVAAGAALLGLLVVQLLRPRLRR